MYTDDDDSFYDDDLIYNGPFFGFSASSAGSSPSFFWSLFSPYDEHTGELKYELIILMIFAVATAMVAFSFVRAYFQLRAVMHGGRRQILYPVRVQRNGRMVSGVVMLPASDSDEEQEEEMDEEEAPLKKKDDAYHKGEEKAKTMIAKEETVPPLFHVVTPSPAVSSDEEQVPAVRPFFSDGGVVVAADLIETDKK